jgi:GGDEF domain-containing protein
MNTIALDYDAVRKLAKKLGGRVNREIKHTDIIDDIASLIGMRGDAMMHLLKQAPAASPAPASQAIELLHLPNPEQLVQLLLDYRPDLRPEYAVIGVIDLYTLSKVADEYGETAAQRHEKVFASFLTPSIGFNEQLYAPLGNGRFIVAWPRNHRDADTEVKRTISELKRCIFMAWNRDAHTRTIKHDFTIGLDIVANEQEAIVKAISRCEEKSARLADVRKQYPFMHQHQFIY